LPQSTLLLLLLLLLMGVLVCDAQQWQPWKEKKVT
jgi:hypothetical protein